MQVACCNIGFAKSLKETVVLESAHLCNGSFHYHCVYLILNSDFFFTIDKVFFSLSIAAVFLQEPIGTGKYFSSISFHEVLP